MHTLYHSRQCEKRSMPNISTDRNPFLDALQQIHQQIAWNTALSHYRFKIYEKHVYVHHFLGLRYFDLVNNDELMSDGDSRIPVFWAKTIVDEYNCRFFTDQKERLVAVFIPNLELNRPEHELIVYKASGGTLKNKLYSFR
jgi:hypothetical protein